MSKEMFEIDLNYLTKKMRAKSKSAAIRTLIKNALK
jgi:hypothetical protein